MLLVLGIIIYLLIGIAIAGVLYGDEMDPDGFIILPIAFWPLAIAILICVYGIMLVYRAGKKVSEPFYNFMETLAEWGE